MKWGLGFCAGVSTKAAVGFVTSVVTAGVAQIGAGGHLPYFNAYNEGHDLAKHDASKGIIDVPERKHSEKYWATGLSIAAITGVAEFAMVGFLLGCAYMFGRTWNFKWATAYFCGLACLGMGGFFSASAVGQTMGVYQEEDGVRDGYEDGYIKTCEKNPSLSPICQSISSGNRTIDGVKLNKHSSPPGFLVNLFFANDYATLILGAIALTVFTFAAVAWGVMDRLMKCCPSREDGFDRLESGKKAREEYGSLQRERKERSSHPVNSSRAGKEGGDGELGESALLLDPPSSGGSGRSTLGLSRK